MSKVSEDKVWFVYVPAEAPETKGERLGPFSERDFVCMYRTKQLTSRTYVWKAGMKDWNRLYTVDKLRQVLQAANDDDIDEDENGEEGKEQKEEEKKEEEEEKKIPTEKGEDTAAAGGDLESELQKEIEKMLEKNLEEEQEQKKLLKKRKYEGKTEEEIVSALKQWQKKYEEARKRKKKEYNKRKKQSKWYAPRINSNIYVEGLPPDITFEEFEQFVQACGIIRVDPNDGKKKIKIYRDEDGTVKGDGMASYMRHESIELAIEILNGKEIKPGFPVVVTKAEFTQKGEEYETRLKHGNKLQKIRIKQEMDNKLTWNQEDDFSNDKGLKIVVLERMYTLEDAADQSNIRELREEILEECEKLGAVEKCELYPHNPQGIVKLKFVSSSAANECIELMNGRFFDGREIKCHYWDGKTDYKKVKESQAQTEARIEDFGKWLEQKEEQKEQNSEQEAMVEGKNGEEKSEQAEGEQTKEETQKKELEKKEVEKKEQ